MGKDLFVDSSVLFGADSFGLLILLCGSDRVRSKPAVSRESALVNDMSARKVDIGGSALDEFADGTDDDRVRKLEKDGSVMSKRGFRLTVGVGEAPSGVRNG